MRTMKITEKTKCWICGRNSKQLKKTIESYWESGELGKDIDIDACFELFDLEKPSGNKMQIPICIVCSLICSKSMLQYILEYLKDNLEVTVEIQKPKVSINI